MRYFTKGEHFANTMTIGQIARPTLWLSISYSINRIGSLPLAFLG